MTVRSPALAIGWELLRRHRWGFAAAAGYVLLLWTARALGPGLGVLTGRDPELSFAFTFTVPTSIFFFYFVAVFSYGLTGDVAARESQFPTRLFSLPVSTAALAGWPMLYGTAVVAGLWLATASFVTWPSEARPPGALAPLLATAMLAWSQALTWMPYGLRGLRVIVALLWLSSLDVLVFLAIGRHASETLMLAFLLPQIPLAYLLARSAVARARRGEVPDWSGAVAWVGGLAPRRPRRRDEFRSAARAQTWFEWRLHGRALPTWVAILLPFELVFLFLAGSANRPLVAYTVVGVLFTPPFMAAFVAARLRRADPRGAGAENVGMPPFIATRPLTSAELVAAKLRMTFGSTLMTWLLVGVALIVALTLSGSWPVVAERVRRLSELVGTPRALAIVALGLMLLVASTWKQLVQGLYIGLSGREWLIRTGTALALVLLIFSEPVIQLVHDSDRAQRALWNAIPWVLAALVALKLGTATWLAPRLQRSGLYRDRVLLGGAAAWLGLVLILHAGFVWLLLTRLFPHYVLLLFAILVVPLVRLAAAPLALARNRHG